MKYSFETKNTCSKVVEFWLRGNIVTNIEKYCGDNMYFALPMAYDEVMKKIPWSSIKRIRKGYRFFWKWREVFRKRNIWRIV